MKNNKITRNKLRKNFTSPIRTEKIVRSGVIKGYRLPPSPPDSGLTLSFTGRASPSERIQLGHVRHGFDWGFVFHSHCSGM